MTPPATIDTPRLHLRLPTLDDAPVIYARYSHDPEVTRYLTWRPQAGVDVTAAFIRRALDAWAGGSAFEESYERFRAADVSSQNAMHDKPSGHELQSRRQIGPGVVSTRRATRL